MAGKPRTTLPPLGSFKLDLQFFGSLTSKNQATLSPGEEGNFSENTELIPTQQLVCSQKLIKINAKQLVLIKRLGITGKEGEKCLIKDCQENNISPSPLCQGHSAGALKYLEKQEKSARTRKWVKEQGKISAINYYQEEIWHYLKALCQESKQLKQLKRKLNQSFQQRGKICQETHTKFFHVDNAGNYFSYQATSQQQKIFYPPDYQGKFQEFWDKTEFLTTIKSQLVWLNSRYSQLQKELQQNQIEIPTFNINRNQH